MRVLKFRAWDKHSKRMVFIQRLDFWDDGKPPFIVPVGETEPLDCDECILMQFTGLHDKNGKEIWEGDIIKFKETIAYDPEEFQERTQQVTFIGGAFSPVFFADWSLHDEDDKPMKIWDVEVLGNIYEHKHLLPGDGK